MERLKAAVSEFPESSGVYLMKDKTGKIIYVGKAVNLKKRVSSYFLKNRDPKTTVLVSKIDDIETIITESEYEALLLENILIKKWTPRYNIRLKDGKSYPVVRITKEDYPRVFKTRRIIRDGSKYFGPFPSAGLLSIYIETIDKIFKLRKCRGPLKKRDNPCLYYHIGRCTAPCVGMISVEDYGKIVEQVEDLLSGDNESLLKWLKDRMTEASSALEYERAAEFRDAYAAAEGLIEEFNQKIIDFNDQQRDYISFSSFENLYTFAVFQMREGRLIGRDLYRTEFVSTDEEALEQFIIQYYSELDDVPGEIYFSRLISLKLLKNFFRKEKKAQPQLIFPEKGQNLSILKMAEENAWQDITKRKRHVKNEEGLEALKDVLGLARIPRRIEGFDIAQLSGKYPAASLVSFKDGVPDRNNYRHFHLKTLDGRIDDFAAVREAVSRRYSRLLNENLTMPDLILIDGGAGQVSAARGVLTALGLEYIPLAGLAKRNEEIYLNGRNKPINLPEGDPALRVLQYVRDETHRFATGFNKKMRQKDSRFSVLEGIPGIGPSKSRKLIQAFGSLEEIGKQSEEKLKETAGLRSETIKALLEEIHKIKS
ncbi:MAG: excinuclease ABC subunit UvrC [Spirochaetales bacterium]|uniref:UvrABC system protein C n=1 Tax=Candidatus Thalassospirochaeta sargassi TaxID=3119039 RepID=A0AAJ1IB79_9SPIO|nr:excinuclease ABC subunit UvrC [Spirochaetales bacterium]